MFLSREAKRERERVYCRFRSHIATKLRTEDRDKEERESLGSMVGERREVPHFSSSQHGGRGRFLLEQERPMDNRPGLVPPHNAPYSWQFMRWNVLNSFLPPLYARSSWRAQASATTHPHTHKWRQLYIKANILNAIHLHCKYRCFVRSFLRIDPTCDIRSLRTAEAIIQIPVFVLLKLPRSLNEEECWEMYFKGEKKSLEIAFFNRYTGFIP